MDLMPRLKGPKMRPCMVMERGRKKAKKHQAGDDVLLSKSCPELLK